MIGTWFARARVALLALALIACSTQGPDQAHGLFGGGFTPANSGYTPSNRGSGFVPASNGGGFTPSNSGAVAPVLLHVGIDGQSNANLRGNSTLVGYGVLASATYAPATIETSSSFTPPPTYASQDLGPIAPTGLNSGFELALGRALIKSGTATATLPLTKVAIDGTAIATWINSTNYNKFVAAIRAREASTGRLLTDNCWAQGEADGATAPLAAAYPADLATFLASFHASFPTARFHFLVLNSNVNIATIPQRAAIRAAQIAAIAANSTWCYAVYADDLELGPDGVHYTANSYWSLGVRFAESIRAAVGNALPVDSTTAPFVRAIDNSSTSNNTVGLGVTAHAPPSKVGDTQVLIVSQGNLNLTPALTTANGFTQITNSPQFSLSGGNYAWLSVYTRVWNGTDADPVVSGLTTQQRRQALILAIGNTSGLAQNANASVNNAFSTSATIASITTPSNNNLVLRIHASYATADNNVSSVSGCTLLRDEYGPVKQMVQIFSDVKAVAGATGACTFTHATTSLQANLVLPFAP